jgi:hypothetical protein
MTFTTLVQTAQRDQTNSKRRGVSTSAPRGQRDGEKNLMEPEHKWKLPQAPIWDARKKHAHDATWRGGIQSSPDRSGGPIRRYISILYIIAQYGTHPVKGSLRAGVNIGSRCLMLRGLFSNVKLRATTFFTGVRLEKTYDSCNQDIPI